MLCAAERVFLNNCDGISRTRPAKSPNGEIGLKGVLIPFGKLNNGEHKQTPTCKLSINWLLKKQLKWIELSTINYQING